MTLVEATISKVTAGTTPSSPVCRIFVRHRGRGMVKEASVTPSAKNAPAYRRLTPTLSRSATDVAMAHDRERRFQADAKSRTDVKVTGTKSTSDHSIEKTSTVVLFHTVRTVEAMTRERDSPTATAMSNEVDQGRRCNECEDVCCDHGDLQWYTQGKQACVVQ